MSRPCVDCKEYVERSPYSHENVDYKNRCYICDQKERARLIAKILCKNCKAPFHEDDLKDGYCNVYTKGDTENCYHYKCKGYID
jgi:hypothetical protein